MFRLKRKESRPLSNRAPRMPTFGFAKICNEDGTVLADATVREISIRGAKLHLRSSAKLPERLIVRSEPDQVCREAKLKWRTGSSIGVEFDQEVEPARKQADPEARIQVVCSHLAGSR